MKHNKISLISICTRHVAMASWDATECYVCVTWCDFFSSEARNSRKTGEGKLNFF